jgi:hypothetical protein
MLTDAVAASPTAFIAQEGLWRMLKIFVSVLKTSGLEASWHDETEGRNRETQAAFHVRNGFVQESVGFGALD